MPNNKITITVGEEVFEFSSFNDWVNYAPGRFQRHNVGASNTICIDAKGRVCLSGGEFMRARDEEAFPVRVYKKLCE